MSANLKKYFYRWPGVVYCFEVYATSREDARLTILSTWKLTRLPRNAEIWQ